MKIVIPFFLLISYQAFSQNIGIGTSNPQATLDVKGNQRIGGNSHFLVYDSTSGKFSWSNSFIWVNAPQYLMMHSASSEGLYYGNSQLEYRYQDGTPRFYTNWNNGNGYFYGNLGIGNAVPAFPLSFAAAIGDKISLYGDAGNHYGFGVQPYLMQIHTDAAASDIAFGYGNSSAFTETMRIKGSRKVGIGGIDPQQSLSVDAGMNIDQLNSNNGTLNNSVLRFGSNSGEAIGSGRTAGADNIYGIDFYTGSMKRVAITNAGNVGIGTSNPAFKLDVADRMRIRSGGGFSSAGLYLNNSNNTQSPAFMGMDDDTHVGFWGSGTGWKFTMNTQTGALKINGSEGTTGQILRSSGPGAPPSWSTPTSDPYNNTIQLFATGQASVTDNAWHPVPGMTYSLNAAGNVKILLMVNIQLYPGACFNCGATSCYVALFVDGAHSHQWTQPVPNGTEYSLSFSYLVSLSPGSHTVDIRGAIVGPSATFAVVAPGITGNNMILQIIPQ